MLSQSESAHTRTDTLPCSTSDTELALLSPDTVRYSGEKTSQVYDMKTTGSWDFLTQTRTAIKSWRWLGSRTYQNLGINQKDDGDERPYQRGWRKAVGAATGLTAVIFLTNLCFAIVTVIKHPAHHGLGQIYEGDCDVVKRYNAAFHVLINILSTVLLGASNYTMQCLSSPTRVEVDTAHSKGVSLSIGLLNVRNFFHMRPIKGILWLCLCLSTLPLHFLWNSSVFVTGASNISAYLVVDESFLADAPYSKPSWTGSSCGNRTIDIESLPTFMLHQYRAGRYQNTSAQDCLNEYANGDGTKLRNLIIVTKPSSTVKSNMSSCGYRSQFWNGSSIVAIHTQLTQAPDWILQTWNLSQFPYDSKNLSSLSKSITNELDQNHIWHFGSYPVHYCLSEHAPAPCKLQYASFMLYTVVACNFIKLICMSMTVIYLWDLDNPVLATVGDAVVSFLDYNDKTTKGLCLLDSPGCPHTVSLMQHKHLETSRDETHILWKNCVPQKQNIATYQREPKCPLGNADSFDQSVLLMLSTTACWTLALAATLITVTMTSVSGKLGAVNQNAILNLDGASGVGLFNAALIANSPQIVFSVFYVIYNATLTARCAALEWASYARKELKPLRVTWPTGDQKSTYFLHLPWKYSIPLMVIQILMHFLLSESLFMARLTYYDAYGDPRPEGFSSVGFSSSGILSVAIVFTVLVMFILGNTFVHLDNRVPIHCNKSVVISASCHTEESDIRDHVPNVREGKLSTKRLMWGVVKEPMKRFAEYSTRWELLPQPGHCTFSDGVVPLPKKSLSYV